MRTIIRKIMWFFFGAMWRERSRFLCADTLTKYSCSSSCTKSKRKIQFNLWRYLIGQRLNRVGFCIVLTSSSFYWAKVELWFSFNKLTNYRTNEWMNGDCLSRNYDCNKILILDRVVLMLVLSKYQLTPKLCLVNVDLMSQC